MQRGTKVKHNKINKPKGPQEFFNVNEVNLQPAALFDE